MLGKTAGGLFWMFRYLERSENAARLLEAGWRMALTRSDSADTEWESVLTTVGARAAYNQHYDNYDAGNVINFLLRDKENPGSILSMLEQARNNARLVRTALSREVWESTNECWMTMKSDLARPVPDRDLAAVLSEVRYRTAVVRGSLHGTMLRNDIYDFTRIGTFLERADNTARILDVKYYILLPTAAALGSSLDNAQWETILRSVSAYRSYRWLYPGDINAKGISDFLILDKRMPRSLAFCTAKIIDHLRNLEQQYGVRNGSHELADEMSLDRSRHSVDTIFDAGLHEFLLDRIKCISQLAGQIESDFRFYG